MHFYILNTSLCVPHIFRLLQLCRPVSALQSQIGLFSLSWTTDEEKTDGHPQTQVPCHILGPKGQEKNISGFFF